MMGMSSITLRPAVASEKLACCRYLASCSPPLFVSMSLPSHTAMPTRCLVERHEVKPAPVPGKVLISSFIV